MIMDDGLSAQWQIFSEASHDWSVMSSMTGPSFESDLLRTTLPMEVVIGVHVYQPCCVVFDHMA